MTLLALLWQWMPRKWLCSLFKFTFCRQLGNKTDSFKPRLPSVKRFCWKDHCLSNRCWKKLMRLAQTSLFLSSHWGTCQAGIEFSPAQILMNRVLWSKLPCTSAVLSPSIPQNVLIKLQHLQTRQQDFCNRGARSLWVTQWTYTLHQAGNHLLSWLQERNQHLS